jgi:hypothetical protein
LTQYSYASSVLGILQSDGESVHTITIPSQKAEDNLNNAKDKANLKKKLQDINLIKLKLTQKQMLTLCNILMKFLKTKLNQGNFGGVAGASL